MGIDARARISGCGVADCRKLKVLRAVAGGGSDGQRKVKVVAENTRYHLASEHFPIDRGVGGTSSSPTCISCSARLSPVGGTSPVGVS